LAGMFTSAALRGFVRDITVANQQTAALTQAALVTAAQAARDRVIAEQSARSGFAPTYRQVVDGVVGAPLTSVRPNGVIVFAWNYLSEVMANALEMAAERSPVQSGDYVRGLTLFADGIEIARGDDGSLGLETVPAGTRAAVIVATAAYSRKLEVGLTQAGLPVVKQVPLHFMQETSLILARMFRDQATISFGFTQMTVGGKAAKTGGGLAAGYPTITIVPRTA